MEAKAAARVFGALAHAMRLELFRTLAREGADGLPAGQLAERVELPPSTLSFHLHELTAAGLLTATRDGRQIRYAIHGERMRELFWFLGEDCLQGRLDLAASPTERIRAQVDNRQPIERRTVLFLCTHNSARSQLAEALLRDRRGAEFLVLSAGTRPRAVHPLTLRVLEEIDVPTEGLHATDLGDLLGKLTIHHAIVLCPETQDECPRFVPFAQNLEFWPMPDPSEPAPSPSAQLGRFRAVRDAIRARLGTWLLERNQQVAAHGEQRLQP